MLRALVRYASATGGTPNNVAIAYTIDEEAGKRGVKALVQEQLPQLGWRHWLIDNSKWDGCEKLKAHFERLLDGETEQ